MRRLFTVVTKILACLLALPLFGPLAQTAMASTLAPGLRSESAQTEATLTVSGSVPALWPGRTATLEVRVTNPSTDGGPVTVRTLDVHVSAASPFCGAENLAVSSYVADAESATYVVAPGQTVVLPLVITFVNTAVNQDACQGVAFPLEYTVTSATTG